MIKRNYGYIAIAENAPSPAATELESQGLTMLRGALTAEQVSQTRTEIDRVFAEYPADERGGREAAAAEMFRYEMLNRSAVCQRLITLPAILEVIEPLLGGDCHVIANTAWRNPPNQPGKHGGEHWHIDAGPHVPLPEGVEWPADIPHPVFAIGTHIYLQDCNLEDGPTGVIPGSHLSGTTPPFDRLLDDDLDWSGNRVVPLIARAGDVGFFVSDAWHRRMTTKPGDAGRYFLQVHYGRRDIAQRIRPTEIENHLDAATIDRATTERERTAIGLHKPFFYDG